MGDIQLQQSDGTTPIVLERLQSWKCTTENLLIR